MPSKNKLLKIKEKEELKQKEEEEKALDKYWDEGTNKKREKIEKEKNIKQMEKMQKIKEKNDLIKQEQEENSKISVKNKKLKRSKNDDLYLLNQSLATKPKSNREKEAEKKELEKKEKIKKLELEKIKQQELQEKKLQEEKNAYSKNMVLNQDHLFVEINNTLEENDNEASNIDNALDIFSNKSSTISFNKYFDQQLSILKQDLPGLKLSQYTDRIHQMWKKSPYNKDNI